MTGPTRPEGTYVDRILAVAQAGGDKEALVKGEQRLSYAEIGPRILRLAAALRDCGVRKGDAVAVLTGNNPDGVLVGLAVHLLGGRLVFTPPDSATSERAVFLQRAETVAFVFDPRVSSGADLARDAGTATVLTLGPAQAGQDLLALAASLPANRPDACAPDDVSTVFHTGGTTGRPKMVLHRHPYYDALIYGADRRYFTFPEPHRFLVPTPLSHTSGHICVIITLLAGGTVVLADGFDAKAMMDTIAQEHITCTMLMPAMLYELLDHPALPAEGFPALEYLNYGGAPASPARLRQALHRFGPVLRQTYALTEAPTIAVLTQDDHDESVPGRLSSAGKPSGLAEISIRGEAGEVAQGEVGEVCVRGPVVMTEYWKDPELTEQAVRDGWLHTGDLGRFDEDGYLHLVDRVTDVIISGRRSAGIYAANVYANLLADVLTAVPGVRAAAIVGTPDELYGEAVNAVCVVDPGVTVHAADLRERAVAELGPLYEPRSVVFADAIPYTALGKPDKKALRRMIENS